MSDSLKDGIRVQYQGKSREFLLLAQKELREEYRTGGPKTAVVARLEVLQELLDAPPEPTPEELKQALKVQQGKLEELQLYKSEHERLKKELNAALHPDVDGPPAPAFCDLVAYTRDLAARGALTEVERRVLDQLAGAWNQFLSLEKYEDVVNDRDSIEFMDAIHRAQNIILKRPTLRSNDI